MSNEVMTRHSEWMSHIVSHLNRMVDDFERTVKNYRPMLGGERFLTDKELCAKLQLSRRTTATMASFPISNLAERYSTENPI